MIHLLKFILLFTSLLFSNDGEGPLLTNIIPTSDFYHGDPIQINLQAIDKDGVNQIVLYYRFNKNDDYKNIEMKQEVNYSAIIPGFEVTSNMIEYYFQAMDIFDNQTIFPKDGFANPFNLPILKELSNDINHYEINLVEPLNNSKTKNVSILIMSIYNQNKNILINNIEIILNNTDITNDCNITSDLITYVPSKRLSEGPYELILKINNKDKPFIKKFYFESLQNLQNNDDVKYAWVDEINYSGNINYSSDYDKFNYQNNSKQPSSRPLDIQRFNLNLTATYKYFKLQSSLLFNTNFIDSYARLNKKNNQPVDRMKLGIIFPYGYLNIGDYSTNFTDLTLKGTRVRGFHSNIQIGLFKFTYIYGKSRELIQSTHFEDPLGDINNDDLPCITLNNGSNLCYEKGTPSRNLRALRTELNFGKIIKIGLTGLTAYDVKDVDVPYTELYSQYLFTGNALVGTDLTLFLNNKRTWLSMETALSMTNNLLDENINNYEEFNLNSAQRDIVGALENFIGFPITTDLLVGKDQGRGLSIPNPPVNEETFAVEINTDYMKDIIRKGTYKIKFKSPFTLFNIPSTINGEYKRIPFSFVSFGNPSIPKDIQGLSTNLKMIFLNNQIMINMGYNNSNDNVNDYKLSTTTSSSYNVGVNINFNKLPNINYSIKDLSRRDNSGLINNRTITHTFTPTYKFNLLNLKIGLNNNLVLMNYEDLKSSISDTLNNNFQQLSFSHSNSLSTRKLSINTGVGISKNIPGNIVKKETEFLALNSKVSYKNNKLSYYIGASSITGESIDINNPINNKKESLKIGAQYKLNKYSSIKYNIEYLIFNDKLDVSNDYTELKGKLSLKISF